MVQNFYENLYIMRAVIIVGTDGIKMRVLSV